MRHPALTLAIALLSLNAPVVRAEPAIEDFLIASFQPRSEGLAALERIEAAGWQDGYAAIFVDVLDLLWRQSFSRSQGWIGSRGLERFLEEQTGQRFGSDLEAWRRWVWSLPYEPHSQYGVFKGALYTAIDPAFADFFMPPVRATIRIDEIQWGGVSVNGIPPLDHPAVVAAADADYLRDSNVVFGIVIDGEARAYPKRILAWHEMALDAVGGEELTVVYCTLCGTVIPFNSNVGGELRKFGTSGLLYQSNKLMFDHETKSLWSSLTGTPVVGPLVGSGLELDAFPVVTTTWGKWRARHPATTVLSIETGYDRNYREGAAYRDYFGTDDLMFDVTFRDERLANKAEVFVLRLDDAAQSIAISVGRLAEERVFHVDDATPAVVVVTDDSGASRAYESGGFRFEAIGALDEDGDVDTVRDAGGGTWQVTEAALVSAQDESLQLPRVPTHRSFWFGWVAQHPDTLLIR